MRHAITLVTVEPARRHRCEACKRIFECHLCGIEETHSAHQQVWIKGVMFVCERCCREKKNRFHEREDGRVMDLLTGTHV